MRIRRSILLDAVSKCCLIADKKDVLLSNVKLKWLYNRVYCSALNEAEALTVDNECSADEPGESVVNADRLKKILSKSKSDTVSLLSKPGNLVVNFGSIKTKLPTVGTFPDLEYTNYLVAFYCEPKQIKSLYERLYSFIGENESRKNLMGLHVNVKGQTVTLTGADAFRIGRDKIENVGISEMEGILPKQSFKNIASIFGSSEKGFNVCYGSKSFLCFGDGLKYKSSAIDAEYPNLERLLQVPDYQCKVDSKSLFEATDMLFTMCNKDTRHTMKAKIKNDSIEFVLHTTADVEGSVEIDGSTNGVDTDIGLNVSYFNQISAIFKKSDMVVGIGFTKSEHPVMLSCDCPEYQDYKAILMPVKLQW